MTGTNVIAASRPWYAQSAERLVARTELDFRTVDRPEALTLEFLREINPDYVFFPHWSWIIGQDLLNEFNCVIFHMTDLPYGRGGSPLQNLIVRGYEETVISAIKCVPELDAGPVYLKKPLSLKGTAEEIFLRAVPIIEDMIIEIISSRLTPIPQSGLPVIFSRRTPEQGDLASLSKLSEVHDYIRMLDAPGYPQAFIKSGALKFEFSGSSLQCNQVEARVRITIEDTHES